MMLIDNVFDLGQMVYLKTDKEQYPRIVTAFIVSSNGIIYQLCAGQEASNHYAMEISVEQNVLLKVE